MLDIKYIKENLDLVKKTVKNKGVDVNVDELVSFYDQKTQILQKIENLRAQRNLAGKKIVSLGDQERKELIAQMKNLALILDSLEKDYVQLEEKYEKLMWSMPLPAAPNSIIGGEEANKVLYKNGSIPKFGFEVKDHIDLGKSLDIIDFAAGVKLMGNRGYFLKNKGAVLEFALMQYGMDFLRKKNFIPLGVPLMAYDKFFYGTGHLPFGGDELFRASDKHKNYGLIGTAEIPLCGYFAEKTLQTDELPQLMMAYSPCFRTEVGSYGKDTKGLYRVKQFYKIEQLVVCKNDINESLRLFELLLANSEEFLQSLGIPYQVLEIAVGDMGAGKYKMYDIESYMPSRKAYCETHSCSALLDWQARRSNIRYTDKTGKKKFVHTLNNTLVASPRILIPLLELNQQSDGSVVIPKVLHKYTGFDQISSK